MQSGKSQGGPSGLKTIVLPAGCPLYRAGGKDALPLDKCAPCHFTLTAGEAKLYCGGGGYGRGYLGSVHAYATTRPLTLVRLDDTATVRALSAMSGVPLVHDKGGYSEGVNVVDAAYPLLSGGRVGRHSQGLEDTDPMFAEWLCTLPGVDGSYSKAVPRTFWGDDKGGRAGTFHSEAILCIPAGAVRWVRRERC